MSRFALRTAALLLLAACGAEHSTAGDARRGRQLIDQYGCNACHSIPGIRGPKGEVGPPLDHIASRPSIGGKLPNTPENMTRWLQNPQAIDPQNTMPNLNLTPVDSRDITAFLYTLK